MSCKKYRAEIEEAESGAAPSRAARLHLEACEACRSFERGRAELRALVGSLARVGAPADFEFRLRARMRAQEPARREGRLFGGLFAPGAATIALAACFAVTVAVSLYVRQKPAANLTTAETARAENSRNNIADAAPPEKIDVESPAAVDAADESVGTVANIVTRDAQTRGARQLAGVARGGRGMTDGVERRNVSFDQRRAPVVTNPAAGQVALTGPTVAVTLPKSDGAMKVVLQDRSGAARVVPVRTVSFGSQDLIARAGGQRAGVRDKEVVW